MLKEIAAITASNKELVEAVAVSGINTSGKILGYMFCFVLLAFTVYYWFFFADKKGYTGFKSISVWWAYLWSGFGVCYVFCLVLQFLVVHTPLQYFVAYLALKYLGLM